MNSSTMDDAAGGRGEHAGFGEMLRKAREAQGLTPAELAAQLNLDVRLIDALEAEDLAALPAPVYVRGYLRRLALNLALEEGTLLRAYQRLDGTAEPAPLRVAPPIETMKPSSAGRRGWSWLIAGLVLGVVVLGFYGATRLPESWVESMIKPSVEGGEHPAVAATTTVPVPTPSIPPPTELPLPPGPPAADHGVPAPVVGEVMPPPASPPPVSEPSTPSGLELRIDKLESWVQIKDAAGKVLFEGMLKPGSTRQIDGVRPFQVVIGRAEAVTLHLDGKTVDLAPYARPNGKAFIARLGG
ncbi:MAG: helix-turn-helix domain-containing protein [Halothiobacillaceae bacterium]